MKFIRNRNQFKILENVQQAKSILKKFDLGTSHPDYQKLRELIEDEFGNLNYLGLMTKYRYEQEISMDELKDMLPWLKDNGNRLPKNPLKYSEFEELKDDIITVDNKQRVKEIYDLYPRAQKDVMELENEELQNKFLKIHEIDKIDQFKQKLSSLKSEEDIKKHLNDFISKYSKDLTEFGTIQKIKKTDSKILYKKGEIIVAEIFDYPASQKLGSSNWCISTGEGSFNSYTRGTKRQFFMWDFSLDQTDPLFLVGFTTNSNGSITNIHDMRDKSLTGSIPSKVREAMSSMDISIKPFEFKQQIFDKVEQKEDLELIELENTDYVLLRLKSDLYLNDIVFNSFTSYDKKANNYYLYDFSKDLNANDFFCHIRSNELKGVKNMVAHYGTDSKHYVINNGKVTTNEFTTEDDKYILSLFENEIVPKDVTQYYEDKKREYLEQLEKIGEKIESHWGESKLIKDTDDQILYQIGHGRDLEKFKFDTDYGIRYDNKRQDGTSIHSSNLYVLVNKDLEPTDKDFIQVIYAKEGKSTVYFHSTDEVKRTIPNEDLPKQIEQLIETGDIVPKSEAEVRRQIKEKQDEFWADVEEKYSDSRIETYGQALYDYLVEEEKIDAEDYPDYKKVIIPNYEHYDLYQFSVYDYSSMILNQGYNENSYAIGTDDEMDKSAYEYQDNLFDELPFNEQPNVINDFINGEDFANDYLADEQNYLEEMVREDPEYYIQKKKVEGYDEKYEALENQKEKLEDQVYDHEQDIEEFKSDIESGEHNEDWIGKIKEDIETLENEINEFNTKIGEIEEAIEEMDDEDNEEYWEYREEDIEAKAEELYDEKYNEVKDDPKGYIEEMGIESSNLEQYIKKDEFIQYIIDSDGRSHGLSGYDGQEYFHPYDGEDYYIIIINKN